MPALLSRLLPLALLASVVGAPALLGPGCACEDPATVDGGTGNPVPGDGGALLLDGGDADAGFADAGSVDAGSVDAGHSDAGAPDAGPDGGGFSWEDLFGDAGLPEELACLPGTAPDLSGGVSAILGALELRTYTGSREDGVVCGDQTCGTGVPCCVLCGWAACAEPGEDGGPPSCPSFTQAFECDGPEDCDDPSADTCCYSLSGTGCRAAEECEITLSLPDGGFSFPFPDDGGEPDGGAAGAGSADAGPTDAAVVDASGSDAGANDDGGAAAGTDDAGSSDGGAPGGPDGGSRVDAGASSATDAGSADAGGGLGDVIGEILDQGVPVCRSFFDCDLLEGEICCTSDLFVNVDFGLCMPALVCVGGQLP